MTSILPTSGLTIAEAARRVGVDLTPTEKGQVVVHVSDVDPVAVGRAVSDALAGIAASAPPAVPTPPIYRAVVATIEVVDHTDPAAAYADCERSAAAIQHASRITARLGDQALDAVCAGVPTNRPTDAAAVIAYELEQLGEEQWAPQGKAGVATIAKRLRRVRDGKPRPRAGTSGRKRRTTDTDNHDLEEVSS